MSVDYPKAPRLLSMSVAELSAYLGVELDANKMPVRQQDLSVYTNEYLKHLPPMVTLTIALKALDNANNAVNKLFPGLPPSPSILTLPPEERKAHAKRLITQVEQLYSTQKIIATMNTLESSLAEDESSKAVTSTLIKKLTSK